MRSGKKVNEKKTHIRGLMEYKGGFIIRSFQVRKQLTFPQQQKRIEVSVANY